MTVIIWVCGQMQVTLCYEKVLSAFDVIDITGLHTQSQGAGMQCMYKNSTGIGR
jgi:hypothetical protein